VQIKNGIFAHKDSKKNILHFYDISTNFYEFWKFTEYLNRIK
jgi:hypothetical protein